MGSSAPQLPASFLASLEAARRVDRAASGPPACVSSRTAPRTGFTLEALGTLLARPVAGNRWIWEGRLLAGTVSAVVAKPKVGKSTFARNLCLAVARGDDFLGLGTMQGACVYLALEERGEDVSADFRALGADGSEPILIHAASAPTEGVARLCNLTRERRPALVVVDPLFRLAQVRDERAYAETYAALGPLIDVARETGAHIMAPHHAGKSLKADPVDAPLGSTALGGAVASLVVLRSCGRYRTLQTVQRVGENMQETVLEIEPGSKRLSLAGTRWLADRDRAEGCILRFLREEGVAQTQSQIRSGVEGQTQVIRAALTHLADSGQIVRSGHGTRGRPYAYEMPNGGSRPIAGTRKPETENQPQTRADVASILVPANGEKPILVPTVEEGQI